MRNLTIAFAISAAVALAAFVTPSVHATSAAGNLGKLAPPSVTSPVEPAACYHRGRYCPRGLHWRCGPYHHHCWCAPC